MKGSLRSMNRENEILAELKALRMRVKILTVLTSVLLIGLGVLAICLLGIDGILAIAAYSALAVIVVLVPIIWFIKVCRFRDQQMKDQSCEEELPPDPANKVK